MVSGSAFTVSAFVAVAVLLSGAGEADALVPFSLINHWYKVACLPSQLKVKGNVRFVSCEMKSVP